MLTHAKISNCRIAPDVRRARKPHAHGQQSAGRGLPICSICLLRYGILFAAHNASRSSRARFCLSTLDHRPRRIGGIGFEEHRLFGAGVVFRHLSSETVDRAGFHCFSGCTSRSFETAALKPAADARTRILISTPLRTRWRSNSGAWRRTRRIPRASKSHRPARHQRLPAAIKQHDFTLRLADAAHNAGANFTGRALRRSVFQRFWCAPRGLRCSVKQLDGAALARRIAPFNRILTRWLVF